MRSVGCRPAGTEPPKQPVGKEQPGEEKKEAEINLETLNETGLRQYCCLKYYGVSESVGGRPSTRITGYQETRHNNTWTQGQEDIRTSEDLDIRICITSRHQDPTLRCRSLDSHVQIGL